MKIKTDNYEIYKGDCLEVMDKLIEQGVKVDAIITDPPYGTTACKWDSVIPFDEMWKRLNKLVKPNGAIVLFGSEPFSSFLRVSNIKNFKYDWIWKKNRAGNFQLTKFQPLKYTEIISVFSNKTHNYYPILREASEATKKRYAMGYNGSKVKKDGIEHMQSGNYKPQLKNGTDKLNPSNILEFKKNKSEFHPTQKPIDLLEYLVKTYTKEEEIVLDFTMGSGSTGVACLNTNRKFIGIELDDKYFEISKSRLNKAVENKEELLKVFDESN